MLLKLDFKTEALDLLTVIVILWLLWPLLPKPTKQPKTAQFHTLTDERRKQEAV